MAPYPFLPSQLQMVQPEKIVPCGMYLSLSVGLFSFHKWADLIHNYTDLQAGGTCCVHPVD
jgi:hypothetical protein